MEQIKFYKYSTYFLLLLNIALISWFFFKGPPPPHHKGRSGKVTASEILTLSKSQNQTFLDLADKHRKQMDGLTKDQTKLMKSYFESLLTDIQNEKTSVLLPQIQEIEREKIEATYNHFQDIKSILKPEQQDNFEEFIEHVLKRILS